MNKLNIKALETRIQHIDNMPESSAKTAAYAVYDARYELLKEQADRLLNEYWKAKKH